jgi:hypothetical protein
MSAIVRELSAMAARFVVLERKIERQQKSDGGAEGMSNGREDR